MRLQFTQPVDNICGGMGDLHTDVLQSNLQQLREQNLLEIIVFIDVMKLF